MLSKNKNKAKCDWPFDFAEINNKKKLKSKKSDFRKKCSSFLIEKIKRLYKHRNINSLYNGKTYHIKCLILLEEEAT